MFNQKNESVDREITAPQSRLVKIGREKGFVTFEDFLDVFPKPEESLHEVDLAFATLQRLGIPIKISHEKATH